jgi:pre-mRNA-splicing factor ISY1
MGLRSFWRLIEYYNVIIINTTTRVPFFLMRKNGHWDTLIVELGGPNYTKVGAKMTNLEGNEVDVLVATDKGPDYRYFEDTKFLPNIKELFNNPPKEKKRRSRYEIYKWIDANYYGLYKNYEDNIL